MPVVVVQPDADHPDLSADRGEEGGIGVRRAVVWHLQDVGPQVSPGGQERLLRLDLGVAREQDALAVDGRPQDQRGVVRVRAGVVERDRRCEDIEMDASDVEALPHRRSRDLQSVREQRGPHELHARRRVGEWSGEHLADVASVENP